MRLNSGNVRGISILIFIFCVIALPLHSEELLRGEVIEELEPVWAVRLGVKSPIGLKEAALWAREDAAAAFSGMIFGWSFVYEPGETNRDLREYLELDPLGEISADDPKLIITETRIADNKLRVWSNYGLSREQNDKFKFWESSVFKRIDAVGFAPLEGSPSLRGVEDRWKIKFAALEEAMKEAIRSELRKDARNRPRRAKGYICLDAFPKYTMNSGRWAASAHFKLQISEIIPFSVY